MALQALAARFVHVGAAMLWVGYLAVLALVLLPASRGEGEHAPNLGPILQRLSPMKWLGPVVFVAGLWLVTASGHGFDQLLEPGWGHAVLGGLGISVVMMGLEHGIVLPRLRDAHQGPVGERDANLATAQRAALAATVLGLLAAFVMVIAFQGGL